MITRFVNNLKLCTRSCLLPFSSKSELPSELDRFVGTLNRARVVAIKINSYQPTIERADKLEALMSEALRLTRKFHGVKAHSDVYASVERVRRLLTPSVRMAKALVRAIEDNMSDESDNESEDESDSEDELSDSESVSEDSSSEEESDSEEEEEMLETPQKPLQADSDCCQKVTGATQMPTALPRRPEDCNTDMSRDLSELLWKTREEVERKQKKGVLNSTKQNSTHGFKNRESQIQSQMRVSLSRCSKKLTASNISSLMGDLVIPVNPRPAVSKTPLNATVPSTCVTEPPKVPCFETKSTTPPIPIQAQPIIPTEDLTKTLDKTFPCVKYEFSKSMCCITDQFSKSSICVVSSAMLNSDPESFIELRDGPVKFLLYPSSLTKVLQQRKKEGQSLKVLNLVPNGAVEDKKMITPIKQSMLTSTVKNEDTVRYYAKVFADKMQQSLSELAIVKAKRQIPSVGHIERVILTAKQVKRAVNLKNNVPTIHPVVVDNKSTYKLSLGCTATTGDDQDETTTRAILGKVCIFLLHHNTFRPFVFYFNFELILSFILFSF